MNSAHWQLVQDLFQTALPLSWADRDRLLEQSGADKETLELVKEMLEADDRGGSALDRGVQHLADEVLTTSGSATEPPIQEFGPYRLLRLLGEGGMGVVWLAERTDTEGQVAVKFLPGAWLSPARQGRFMQEVRLLAKLKHPGIACLYDAGTLPDGTPWFAMEYVDGRSFAAYCGDMTSLKGLLQLFCAVCETVQHAHSKGVIHRDLKPSNLLVEPNGTPKLLDFGIASELDRTSSPSGLTALGLRFASPPYSAPEYIKDGTATAMSDVYSLGVVLYELLTGVPLTTKEGGISKANANAVAAEFRPSLAARRSRNSGTGFMTKWHGALAKIAQSEWNDLDVLCLKATHSDPARRYQSVEALVRDLQHFLHGEPLEARPDSWRYRSSKFLRRNALAVIATAVTVCVLLTMAIVFTVRLAKARNEALAQADRATRVQQFMLELFSNKGRPTDAPGSLTVEALVDRGTEQAEAFNQDPVLQADLYATLGQMYFDIGRLSKAEDIYSKAFAIQERQPGVSVSSRVDVRLKLADVLEEENKLAQTHALVADTIQFITMKSPSDRISKLKAETEWAGIIRTEGKYSEAEQLLKAVANEQEMYAAPKSDLVQTLRVLSSDELYTGHYQDGDKANLKVISLCASDSACTPELAQAMQDLSESAEVQGRYAQSEQYGRQSLRIFSDWYGSDNRVTANEMTSLAATLTDEHKYAEADSLLHRSMAIEEKAYPSTSGYLSKVFKNLGMLQMALGHYDAALAAFERVMYIYTANHAVENYLIGRTYIFQGLAYLGKNDLPRAEDFFRRALQMLSRVRGETDIYTARAHLNLGHTLLLEKHYEEAEANLQAACETFKSLSMEQTEFMQQGRADLATVHAALHQPMETTNEQH